MDNSGSVLCAHFAQRSSLTPVSEGDVHVVTHHNQLRDVHLLKYGALRKHVCMQVRIEMGSGLTATHSHSHPGDVLVTGWEGGKPAEYMMSPLPLKLNPAILDEARQVYIVGTAAQAAESHKHMAKYQKLG